MALMQLDTSEFNKLLRKIDSMGGNVQMVVEKTLVKAGEKINRDTEEALALKNLPAHGKYSTGRTKEGVITDAQVHWDGSTAYVPVGFDFSKPGAGGYLITGTPRMVPDPVLNRMFRQKKYMREIQREMQEEAWDEIVRLMEK